MNGRAQSRLDMMNWDANSEESLDSSEWVNIELESVFDPLEHKLDTKESTTNDNNLTNCLEDILNKNKLFNSHVATLPKLNKVFIEQNGAKTINLDGFCNFNINEININGTTSDTEFILNNPLTVKNINIVSATGYPQKVYELLSKKDLFPNLTNINITTNPIQERNLFTNISFPNYGLPENYESDPYYEEYTNFLSN